MDLLNILEATLGVFLSVIIIFIIIAAYGAYTKYSDSKKMTTPEGQKKALDTLLKNGAISKKEYKNFLNDRKHHEDYDKGEITVDELEKRTGKTFGYLRKPKFPRDRN